MGLWYSDGVCLHLAKEVPLKEVDKKKPRAQPSSIFILVCYPILHWCPKRQEKSTIKNYKFVAFRYFKYLLKLKFTYHTIYLSYLHR